MFSPISSFRGLSGFLRFFRLRKAFRRRQFVRNLVLMGAGYGGQVRRRQFVRNLVLMGAGYGGQVRRRQFVRNLVLMGARYGGQVRATRVIGT